MPSAVLTLLAVLPVALCSETPHAHAWPSLQTIEPFDAVHHASERGNRSKRQLGDELSLAIPSGAIISIAPRFGWLLYQGTDEEDELDLVFDSEFLYKFPREEKEEHEMEEASHERRTSRRQRGWKHSGGVNTNMNGATDFLLHRNKRMVRDKRMVYGGLENVFSILGLDGRACLLRAICEVTATPLVYDGIVGELLNMALVPRHTNGHHEDLKHYLEAEEHGTLGSDCGAVYPACPISLFQKVEPGSVHFE